MKPSVRAYSLLIAALLPLSACGIPETGVVEAGEPATGVLDPGVTSAPSQSVPEAVPLVKVPLYFVEDGSLVAVDRTVPGPTDLGSSVLMLFKGPDDRERGKGLTTELPPAAEAPTIRTDGTGVTVQLPRSAGILSDTAVDQLACTVAVARLRQDPALGRAQVTVEQPGGRLAGRSSDDCPFGGARETPGAAESTATPGTGGSAAVEAAATTAPAPHVRAHALATRRLLRDPDSGFEAAIEEAKRVVALGGSGHEGP